VSRRILILGEGATELRAPGEQWSGCGRVLLRRMFGEPTEDLLSFEEHVLSRFRRDPDLTDTEPRIRGESEQAQLACELASRDANALVLMRDDDHRDRRANIERGLAEARAQGHSSPAVLALAIECVEAWVLTDPDAWQRVYGKKPTLPSHPEMLWGDRRDSASNHPKCVLRRCFEEIDRKPGGNAVARLLEHASLELIASRCPEGFGRFMADLQRAFPPIECVVAASSDRAIGLDGEPPWGAETLRDHMDHVRRLASAAADGSRAAVIMGRKAWQVLPALPASSQRVDIVVTRGELPAMPADVYRAVSFDAAIGKAVAEHVDRIYVLGGGELYREALGHFRCTEIHYTRVDTECPGADTLFPEFEGDKSWTCAPSPTQHHDNGFDYRIERWSRFTG
jgi:dihydrofolate reductase